MKHITITIAWLLSLTVAAQSTSPDVIASSGEYYENANNSISYTLGEIAVETYSNGSNILTQGFQQPVSVTITGIDLDLLVYLEGPYSGSQMNTTLNTEGLIPLSQPFNVMPWNYQGTESVTSIPNSNVVDWVLVDIRDAMSAGTAIPPMTKARQAAFLLKNGDVVGLDGSSILNFPDISITKNLFVVIWHRNHLGILSAVPLTETNGIYSYDFSTAITQVYNGGAGYKEIATGIFGMVAGDADADGEINTVDKTVWANQAGTRGYESADFDMNTQVDNKDKNDIWSQNGSYSSQLPE